MHKFRIHVSLTGSFCSLSSEAIDGIELNVVFVYIDNM